jgi:ribosomal protein L37AE/L43A
MMKIKMLTNRRAECTGCDKFTILHSADSGAWYCHDCAVEIIAQGHADWDGDNQPRKAMRIS